MLVRVQGVSTWVVLARKQVVLLLDLLRGGVGGNLMIKGEEVFRYIKAMQELEVRRYVAA